MVLLTLFKYCLARHVCLCLVFVSDQRRDAVIDEVKEDNTQSHMTSRR